MNQGKRFEQNFEKSKPDYAMLYRLHDSAQSFGRASNLRFSLKNPFDYFLFDAPKGILYGLELKSVQGKSISFERSPNEHGTIHYHQIRGLHEHNQYENTVSGFIIEFRSIETTVFIKTNKNTCDFSHEMNCLK